MNETNTIKFTCQDRMVSNGTASHQGCGDTDVTVDRVRLLDVDELDGTATSWAVISCPTCGAPTNLQLQDYYALALSAIGVEMWPASMVAHIDEVTDDPSRWSTLMLATPSEADVDLTAESERVVAELEKLLAAH